MICTLEGKLIEKKIDVVTVDVKGVGYEVFIPLKTYAQLPEEGENVFLYIQTILKEDGLFLYGFLSRKEKEVFNLLRIAKGVGVKTAFNLLSSLESDEIINAIANEDSYVMLKVPNVGKKTAERIIFELKEKVKKFTASVATQKSYEKYQDVELALISLGYSPKDAKDALKTAIISSGDDSSTEKILKSALNLLVKG